ncbi:MAG: hypothetical protein WCG83_07115 [Candidatus Peregrinibacteria bacterium]
MPSSPSSSPTGLRERTDRHGRTQALDDPRFDPTRNDAAERGTDVAAYAHQEHLLKRREDLRSYFRNFIVETFDTLGIASLEETRALEEGLHHIGLSEEEIRGWEDYRNTIAEQQLRSGRLLADTVETIFDNAVKAGHISKESKHRWIQERFRNKSLPYKAREFFVLEQLPSFSLNWKREAEKRRNLLKEPSIRSLSVHEVRKLDLFFDEGKFLAMHFDKRMEMNASVHAALLSRRQKTTQLHLKAKDLLEAAAKARAISPHKVGLWLEHIVYKYPDPADRDQFIDIQLKDYIKEWVKVRTAFDAEDAKLRKGKVPQGFNRLSLPQFLSLNFEQRRSYVETLKQRNNSETDQGKDELRNCKLLIKNSLDMKDWDQAEKLLKSARKVHTERALPQDYELDSMERYQKAFRDKSENERGKAPKEVQQTLDEMRQIFAGDAIPLPLRQLYLKAMMDQDTFACLGSLIYNRIWCTEHGYLDTLRERRLLSTSTEETKHLAKGKHKKKGLENIRLNTVNEWQEPSTVRRYDEGEWAPTVIHMPPGGDTSLLEMIKPRKNNGSFRYWATLIPTDVSYEKQQNLVKNVNWRLKRGIGKLKEAGFAFSLIGHPVSLN